ncbi:DNA-binding transcriptional MerR regulator [Roseovarius sp. MBR-78]|jgi:DNA-binding transcriptional MerR regulator|uniref:MerR family transcriptional regulator n=1 Tax=Roseovarius sp. MBR-78 TaxID=3156460 RepID=UPI003393F996
MGKSADAFRTISEVADWLEVPAHVLRFWESKFTQVKPVKRAGGRRYYRPADMRLLGGIKALLHDHGLTIKGVQKILRDQGVSHVAALSPDLGDEDEAAPATTTTPARASPPRAAQVLSFARPEASDDAPPPDETSPDAPADTPTPEDETALDPSAKAGPPDADAAPDPGTPALPPLPDLPADPPDTAAAPGPLARLAALPRPLSPALAGQLAALADKLRQAHAPKA